MDIFIRINRETNCIAHFLLYVHVLAPSRTNNSVYGQTYNWPMVMHKLNAYDLTFQAISHNIGNLCQFSTPSPYHLALPSIIIIVIIIVICASVPKIDWRRWTHENCHLKICCLHWICITSIIVCGRLFLGLDNLITVLQCARSHYLVIRRTVSNAVEWQWSFVDASQYVFSFPSEMHIKNKRIHEIGFEINTTKCASGCCVLFQK